MANSLSDNFPEYWSRAMQRYLSKEAVYQAIVSTEAQAVLKNGDTFHKPYGSDVVVSDYNRGSSFTVQDITTNDEYLTVDKQKVVPFYIDKYDEIQDNYSIRNYFIKRSAIKLANTIDADVLAEVVNASYTVDYHDIDSTKTAGYACPLSTTTIAKIFTTAHRKMSEANVPLTERIAVVDPHFISTLTEYFAGKATNLGDRVNENGYYGDFMGVKLYTSNSLYWTGKLGLATNPTDGDTISINGVTFTFKSTLGTEPGNVKICSSVANTIANFVNAFNTPGTSISEATNAGYVPVTAANQQKLKGITATAGTKCITFASKGWGYVPVAETLTDATDKWDDNLCMVHYLFGRKGAIHLVIQSRPNVSVKDVSDKLGVNIVSDTLYGIKTFTEGKNELVDVKVNTVTW